MKKLFTLVAMALMAVGANAQTLIAEQDWTGGYEGDYPFWFGSSEGTDATIASDADGVALTNPRKQDQIWTPQTIVLGDVLTLEEDHNYLVRLTVKVPQDGTYQVQLGSWATNFQYEVPVTASDDWQVIDVEFNEYGGTTDENAGHVVFQNGWVIGTTIVKKVEVFEVSEGGEEPVEPAGEVMLAEQDWNGGYEGDYPFWFGSSEGTDATIASDAEGVALYNPRKQDQIWTPQTIVLGDVLTLEEDHNYLVRIEVKVPEDGTYQVQLGSWATNFQYEVPVTASDDFQTIDVEFFEYGGTTDENAGHVVFQNGWVTGTTIVKNVKVFEVGGETAIKSVKKAAKANGAIYNLAGQKVNASYKGIVIKDGKKFIQK